MTRQTILFSCSLVALLGAGPIALAASANRSDITGQPAEAVIVVDGVSFSTWQEYTHSDVFQQKGLRCGTVPARVNAGFRGGGSADCSFDLTTPDATYAPSVVPFRIPVVVHVIRNDSGSQGNVSEALAQSQIEILNEDFLALPGTNGASGTDIQIEFYLATEDPDGNATSGVTYSNNSTWFDDGGAYWNTLAWDTNRYLNIYTNTAGGNLGYVPNLPQGGIAGSNSDRVVILWSTFGRNAPFVPYDQGRTTTHEVGHYLGLFHTFSGGCASPSNCYRNGDLICDTNPEATSFGGCGPWDSCSNSDPTENYMDYSEDLCLFEFTPEQARRMRCSLENYRPDLYETLGCVIDSECSDGNPCNGAETCNVNISRCVLAFNDCNENAIDDACDVSDCGGDPACADCNANGVPDRCDLFDTFVAASPVLSPVVGGQSLNYEISSAPERAGDVSFSFVASADLGAPTNTIDVQVNGQSIGIVFGSDGETCPGNPDTAEIILSAAEFDAILSFGSYAIALIPSGNVNGNLCSPSSFITVAVRYETRTGLDCNLNNIPDECEPDCQPNGIPDDCELADGSVEDCQPNGVPDTCDIASGTSEDANGTGIPDECEPCTSNAECNESGVCEFGRCLNSVCEVTPVLYGDVASAGGVCGPDGSIELADILAILDGFGGVFRDGCERVNMDIAGANGSCTPDDQIDLSDILSVLDAFQGLDRCCASRR